MNGLSEEHALTVGAVTRAPLFVSVKGPAERWDQLASRLEGVALPLHLQTTDHEAQSWLPPSGGPTLRDQREMLDLAKAQALTSALAGAFRAMGAGVLESYTLLNAVEGYELEAAKAPFEAGAQWEALERLARASRWVLGGGEVPAAELGWASPALRARSRTEALGVLSADFEHATAGLLDNRALVLGRGEALSPVLRAMVDVRVNWLRAASLQPDEAPALDHYVGNNIGWGPQLAAVRALAVLEPVKAKKEGALLIAALRDALRARKMTALYMR